MDIHPLRAFRESHEPPLSQADLAALLGVQTPTVWRWEANERKIDDGLVPTVSKTTGIPVAVLRPDLAELFRSEEAAE